MENMLVSFRKDNDQQFHCFTGCDSLISFVHDSVFRSFMDHGYTWSAIPLPDQLVNDSSLMFFTVSEVEK